MTKVLFCLCAKKANAPRPLYRKFGHPVKKETITKQLYLSATTFGFVHWIDDLLVLIPSALVLPILSRLLMKENRKHQQTSIVSRCRQQDTPVISSSNKYLVYFAMPDALFNLLWPGAYGCFASDYWNEAIGGYIAMASFSEKRHPWECCVNDDVCSSRSIFECRYSL